MVEITWLQPCSTFCRTGRASDRTWTGRCGLSRLYKTHRPLIKQKTYSSEAKCRGPKTAVHSIGWPGHPVGKLSGQASRHDVTARLHHHPTCVPTGSRATRRNLVSPALQQLLQGHVFSVTILLNTQPKLENITHQTFFSVFKFGQTLIIKREMGLFRTRVVRKNFFVIKMFNYTLEKHQ